MNRRRSALTVSTAVALAVAAPLLTGCGSDARPGAAAVVDGDRITMAALQSQVGAVRDAQRASPQGEELIQRSGQLTRAKLDGMIRERVVRQAADEAGVTVTRREVQQAREQFEKQPGGAQRMEATLLQQQGVASSGIDDWIWLQVAVQEIAEKSGHDLRTPQGNKALSDQLTKVSEKMNIDVNPRYGEWDARKATLAEQETPWLNDLTKKKRQQEQLQQQQQLGT
ncbi:SurA N-terminal domain-containing protein [Streptomyces oceani]|uniref:SurA N-terminal domain-containing protein n=1 Tax=Streptomyces oceani TaxID=1075402 RepID=A0A1E7KN21_9ACTN|nr:SurA N-terminal domain-containing protein [Streptomyces oceani]OEV05345.1 hypothetical protein AN216_03330 [Streptomyces oceani]